MDLDILIVAVMDCYHAHHFNEREIHVSHFDELPFAEKVFAEEVQRLRIQV